MRRETVTLLFAPDVDNSMKELICDSSFISVRDDPGQKDGSTGHVYKIQTWRPCLKCAGQNKCSGVKTREDTRASKCQNCGHCFCANCLQPISDCKGDGTCARRDISLADPSVFASALSFVNEHQEYIAAVSIIVGGLIFVYRYKNFLL